MLTVEGLDTVVADMTAYPGMAQRAMVRAMNRAITSGRSVMVRAMAGDTGLRQTDLREAMPIQNATRERMQARFGASLKRIPLIKFSARGPEPSRGRGRGVSYRNPGGGRDRLANAFIGTMRSGHRGVFRRMTKSRLPIVELYGPSLGRVFEKFRSQGVARVEEAFESNFDHELRYEQSQGR